MLRSLRGCSPPWRAFLLALICCGASTPAHASPFDVYGAGGEDSASGARTAAPTGAASIHYNVGALTETSPGLSVGLLGAVNRLSILMTPRPAGYDIPDLGDDSPALPSSSSPAPEDVEGVPPLYAATLGVVTGFGLDRLRVGALVFLPTQSAVTMRTHFSDERERYASNRLRFELLDDRLRRLDIQAGAAFSLREWISLGAGLMIAPNASLNNDVTLKDAANQEDAQINLSAETGANLGWMGGALLKIGDALRLGVSWRSPVYIEVTGENRIFVQGTEGPDGQPQTVTQELSFVPSYSPARGSFGASWRGDRLGVDLDVRYMRWSQYLDTHGAEAGFEDRFNVHLGGQWAFSEDLVALVGVGYEPTPVPAQTGRTNYVDNDRGVFSLGAGHDLSLGGAPTRLEWFGQFHVLSPRTTRKDVLDTYPECADGVRELCDEVPDDTADSRTGQTYPEAAGLQTGNPGFPGFSSGGWVGVFGFKLTWGSRP